jgi:hypothetical protein
MPYLTNYQYYENGGTAPTDANQGSYQYLTIAEIINSYMLNYVGEDKQVDNVQRHIVRFHAKQAVKELNFDSFRSIKVLEYEIGSDLKLVMPHDYVDYLRISKEKNGELFPMTENTKAMSAKRYLLDNNDDLQFDGDGNVLYDTTTELDDSRLSNSEDPSTEPYYHYSIGGKFWLDPSNAKSNPVFRINRATGVIDFDSTMSGELVVLEYISDGMEGGNDADIVVNKYFEKYLYAYITSEILQSKRGIPEYVIRRAMKKASALRSNANIRIKNLHPSRLLMVLRGRDKWIK